MGTRRLVKIYLVVEVDHPHACGDKYYNTDGIYTMWGSSPRVWGQVPGLTVARVTGRIIPTRVGTSNNSIRYGNTYADHPHACGDKVRLASPEINILGSSPRVWGQEVNMLSESEMGGIIPTRVGTSCKARTLDGNSQDHPHACGDKSHIALFNCVLVGSSPRVWGQVLDAITMVSFIGIIPTRVGTSKSRLSCIVAKKDHPHACGDK